MEFGLGIATSIVIHYLTNRMKRDMSVDDRIVISNVARNAVDKKSGGMRLMQVIFYSRR